MLGFLRQQNLQSGREKNKNRRSIKKRFRDWRDGWDLDLPLNRRSSGKKMDGQPDAKNMAIFHTVYVTEVFSHPHHELRPQSEVLLQARRPQVQVAELHA